MAQQQEILNFEHQNHGGQAFQSEFDHGGQPFQQEFEQQQRILCASCGTAIAPNAANMCLNCIRSDVDISDGIPKQATIHFCKGCDRFYKVSLALTPP